VVLVEQGALIEWWEGHPLVLGKVVIEQVLDILRNLVKGKGEEALLGFEVAQVQHEGDLGGHRAEQLHEVLLRLHEGKVGCTVVSGEAGPSEKRLNLVVVQDTQALWRCGCIWRGHALVPGRCQRAAGAVSEGIPSETGGVSSRRSRLIRPVS